MFLTVFQTGQEESISTTIVDFGKRTEVSFPLFGFDEP